jgi:cobalt-precorrin-5B (C1)-methyltransferase
VRIYHRQLCGGGGQSSYRDAVDRYKRVDNVSLLTPKGITLNLEPEDVLLTPAKASCAIRKDSGDDPDDTNGILVYATVEKDGVRSGISWRRRCRTGDETGTGLCGRRTGY